MRTSQDDDKNRKYECGVEKRKRVKKRNESPRGNGLCEFLTPGNTVNKQFAHQNALIAHSVG